MKQSTRSSWMKEVGATSIFLIIFGLIRIFLLSQQGNSPHVSNNTVAALLMAIYACIAIMMYLAEGKLKAWVSFSLNGMLLNIIGYLAWDLTAAEKRIFYSIFVIFITLLVAAVVNVVYFFKYKDEVSYTEKIEMNDFLFSGVLAKIVTFIFGFTLIEYLLIPIIS